MAWRGGEWLHEQAFGVTNHCCQWDVERNAEITESFGPVKMEVTDLTVIVAKSGSISGNLVNRGVSANPTAGEASGAASAG